MWVYQLSEQEFGSTLYTVGFYKPDGTWEPESDHSSKKEARDRVHYLNGGASVADAIAEISARVAGLEEFYAGLTGRVVALEALPTLETVVETVIEKLEESNL